MVQSEAQYRKEVRWCKNGDRQIYGAAFCPAAEGRHPLVIFSHELGSNHRTGIPYAKRLAAMGYAFYAFDFCGGSAAGGQSDGKTTEMTVSSELSDLEAVLNTAKTWEFVDPERIVLMGGSQGGVVSAMAASGHQDAIRGLILLYPAFSAVDHIHALFPSTDAIPEEFDMFGGWIRLGRCYARDLWDRDFYSMLQEYSGRVLLLHGDCDHTVPISYSERAAGALQNCTFYVIPGGDHIFSGSQAALAAEYISDFLKNILTV